MRHQGDPSVNGGALVTAIQDDLNRFTLRFTRVGGWVVLQLDGELDARTCPALRDALVDTVDGQGNLFVVVDLSGVTFIDSAGIGVLVGANRRLRARGGELRISNPCGTIAKAFEVTRLDRELTITHT